jgi:hypothetical protein
MSLISKTLKHVDPKTLNRNHARALRAKNQKKEPDVVNPVSTPVTEMYATSSNDDTLLYVIAGEILLGGE